MRSKKNAEKKGNVPEGLSCSKSFFLPKILPPECEMSKGLRLPNQEAKFIENAADYCSVPSLFGQLRPLISPHTASA